MVRRTSFAHHFIKTANHPEQVSPEFGKDERVEGLLQILKVFDGQSDFIFGRRHRI